MGWTARFDGLQCVSCGDDVVPAADVMRCPACGGALTVAMDATGAELADTPPSTEDGDMWAFAELLPVAPADGDLRAGGTPLVAAPSVADAVGFDRVLVKDESRNPTGSVFDRDLAIAGRVGAALGASTLALPAAGAAGQATAAIGARLGLSVQVYVPSRANFTAKATINVAGGEMTVVPGRYADARATFAEAETAADWYSVEGGVNPFLRAGRRTVYWEILAALDGSPPDVLVVPVATGDELVALVEAAALARTAGMTDDRPVFLAVQPEGCAPVVEAFDNGTETPTVVESPDTICGELEIADPPAGGLALAALRRVDGLARTVTDEALYRAAIALARSDGIVPSLAGGAAAAALEDLDEPSGGGTAVVLNPSTGLADADRLRSYLMSQGE